LSHAARKRSRRLESIDIAGAFLKGFSFSEIQRALREAGVDPPSRVVVLLPPLNVFRHLSDLSPDFKGMTDLQAMEYGLLCIKPVYGLNDAPLLWHGICACTSLSSNMVDTHHIWTTALSLGKANDQKNQKLNQLPRHTCG